MGTQRNGEKCRHRKKHKNKGVKGSAHRTEKMKLDARFDMAHWLCFHFDFCDFRLSNTPRYAQSLDVPRIHKPFMLQCNAIKQYIYFMRVWHCSDVDLQTACTTISVFTYILFVHWQISSKRSTRPYISYFDTSIQYEVQTQNSIFNKKIFYFSFS